MIAVTGDLVDGTVQRLASHVAPLARLTSRHGTYFVTGNHEYYSGVPAWIAELRRLGLRVLLNEHVVLQHDEAAIVVAGVTDYGAHHFDRAAPKRSGGRARRRTCGCAVRILLAHQPRSAPRRRREPASICSSRVTRTAASSGRGTCFVRFQQPFTAGLHRLRDAVGLHQPRHRLLGPAEALRCAVRDHPAAARSGALNEQRQSRRERRLTIDWFDWRMPVGAQTRIRTVFISEAFAQAAPCAPAAADSPFGSLGTMLPLVLMFVVLYFVMIRPQMKRQKEHKTMIEALAKGDEVVTSGGLAGRITKLGESFLGVEIANGVEIQVQRAAVVQVLPKGTVK